MKTSNVRVRQDSFVQSLKLPEERATHIGVWGQRHLRYLKQHRKVLYSELMISGKLNDYLA
ncbi:MAG: TnpV protein, partial [Coprococcus catus]|nr:TnpV protein [Coprococcus catus]